MFSFRSRFRLVKTIQGRTPARRRTQETVLCHQDVPLARGQGEFRSVLVRPGVVCSKESLIRNENTRESIVYPRLLLMTLFLFAVLLIWSRKLFPVARIREVDTINSFLLTLSLSNSSYPTHATKSSSLSHLRSSVVPTHLFVHFRKHSTQTCSAGTLRSNALQLISVVA